MPLLCAVGYLVGGFTNKLTTVSTSSSSFVVTSAAALELGEY